MLHTISLVVALLCIAAMNLLIKAGARAMEGQQQVGASLSLLSIVKTALVHPWIIGGMICGILKLAPYTFALRKFPVSTAYPIMTGISYAIIVCGAAVWFSERLNVRQMVGVGLILAGVWMVASGMAKTG